MCHVNDGTGSSVFSGIDNQLEGNLDFVGDVLTADLVLTEAKSATFAGAWRALAPADGADTRGVMFALGVAEGSALNFVLSALEGKSSGSAVGFLGA